jgi:hypothetical protein
LKVSTQRFTAPASPILLDDWAGCQHKDETRVQMAAKMFPHLKLLCWLFMDPTIGFDT